MSVLRVVGAAVLAAVASTPSRAASPEPQDILGTRPAFVTRPLSEVPNVAAIVARIWVPDLDEGFVPQGLAMAGDHIVLSAYRSSDAKQGRGACRVFLITAATGAVTHRLDLPETCGHAGGVAVLEDGRIVVADTHILYLVAAAADKVLASVNLKGKLLGSFADSDGHALWIGSYNAKSGGTIWRLPLTIFDHADIDESAAEAAVAIPARVQGLAFDRKGSAWLTVSGSRDGALLRINPQTGAVLANYAMPAGIEDIGVDSRGRIWAVSEAGSIRWSNWPTNFPLVFAIDPDRLR